MFARLGIVVGTSLAAEETLSVVTAAAIRAIDGADAAAVTRGRDRDFETVAATCDLAVQVDKIQYDLMSSGDR